MVIESLLQLTKSPIPNNYSETDTILLSAQRLRLFRFGRCRPRAAIVFIASCHQYCVADVYVTHDHGFYHGLVQKWKRVKQVSKTSSFAPDSGSMGMVQSRPEAVGDASLHGQSVPSPWSQAWRYRSPPLCPFALYKTVWTMRQQHFRLLDAG